MTEGDPKKKRKLSVNEAIIIGSLSVIGALHGQKAAEKAAETVLDGQHERNAEVQKLQTEIEHTYGIKIRFIGYDETHERLHNYNADRLSSKEAVIGLKNLTIILAKYPPSFFKDNALPEIFIGKNIVLPEREAGLDEEKVDGFAAYTRNFIVLEFIENRDAFEEVTHHELFHILDARDNGYDSEDEDWVSLHAECKCRPYVGNNWRKPVGERTTQLFANEYARKSPVEDRAVIGAALFSPYLHYLLIQKMQDDDTKILYKKYLRIRATYERWSNGALNQAYWDDIIARGKTQVEELRGYAESYEVETYQDDWYFYYDSNEVVVREYSYSNPRDYEGFSVDHPRYYDDKSWTTDRYITDTDGKPKRIERPTEFGDYEGFSDERSQVVEDSDEKMEGPD